jgi:uncharacterized membrane protein HdeD (DUF308 family)
MSQDVRPAVFTWKWFVVLGGTLIVLGAAGLGSAALPVVLPLVLGPILMASGILQVLLALFTSLWKGSALHLMASALDLVVGLIVLTHPAEAAADLALVLAAYLMVGGLYRIFGSLLWHLPARGWALAAGAVPLVLGVLLWQRRPFQEVWLFGLCLGADFICHGASWLLFSRAVRTLPSAKGKPVAPPSPPPLAAEPAGNVRQMLDRFQASIDRETKTLEGVDELIHKAKKRAQQVYGEEPPKV